MSKKHADFVQMTNLLVGRSIAELTSLRKDAEYFVKVIDQEIKDAVEKENAMKQLESMTDRIAQMPLCCDEEELVKILAHAKSLYERHVINSKILRGVQNRLNEVGEIVQRQKRLLQKEVADLADQIAPSSESFSVHSRATLLKNILLNNVDVKKYGIEDPELYYSGNSGLPAASNAKRSLGGTRSLGHYDHRIRSFRVILEELDGHQKEEKYAFLQCYHLRKSGFHPRFVETYGIDDRTICMALFIAIYESIPESREFSGVPPRRKRVHESPFQIDPKEEKRDGIVNFCWLERMREGLEYHGLIEDYRLFLKNLLIEYFGKHRLAECLYIPERIMTLARMLPGRFGPAVDYIGREIDILKNVIF